MKIYFLQFQSKVNRIVKSYADIDGYSSFIIQEIGSKDATNFPYSDGVVTKEFYNFKTDKMPDYAIIADNDGIVRSRWYIEQTRYTRSGQWEVTFRRDVLADFNTEILSATVLIEKATVSDNDPAIYNQEPITFNSIKKKETILRDSSGISWLVGYISADNSSEKKYDASTSTQIRKTVAGIANWEYYRYTNEYFVGPASQITYNVKYNGQNSSTGFWLAQMAFNTFGGAATDTANPTMGYQHLSVGDYAYNESQKYNANKNTYVSKVRGISGNTWNSGEVYSSVIDKLKDFSDLDSIFINQLGTLHTPDEEGAFKAMEGMLIYDSVSQKAYRVDVRMRYREKMERYAPGKGSSIYNRVKSLMAEAGRTNYNDISNSNNDIYVKYYANYYNIVLTEVENHNVSVTITSSRHILNDAPYTMFAIPYEGVTYKVGIETYESDREAALAIARQITMDLKSSGALYDLQLLPYCPRQDLIDVGFIDLRSAQEHEDYEIITDGDNTFKSFLLFCKESSFTFDINEEIIITEKKVQNQCDMWRLCSPNYNGVFEFNAAKNNGVNYFNVDCTYRPYNPYIHVNPNFKDLYGSDYDDARGLICAGDFSMPACTDKWLEYEAQNKNYQNSFDRSIQHLEIEQKYQRINQIAGAIGGVGAGAVGGGVIGGIPGAIAGGALSAAGGLADVLIGEQMRTEQIRYQKDIFAFNLENIKALPNSLAKVSAFNKNNKIFPFLEYYTCTEIEKEAFRNMIKYDGMTVNRIGTIAEYLKENDIQYIKATLIRCDIHDDLHIVDVIASELMKGAYYDTRNDQ